MIPIFRGRRILLGVSGSIAAYKAADLASRLTQAGALVDAVLTEAATKFVTPLTFQSVTGRPAHASLWGSDAHILHVGLAESAELLLVAPATADVIAKIAHGLADDLLTVTALAARCPVLLAPAMDGAMFGNPAVQENLAALRRRGVTVIGPAAGRMASGLEGLGRMLEPEEIVGHVRRLLGQSGPLAGRRVVVSAGGTQEPVDPVRVLANRSSGKQGFAIAQAALDHGAHVTLVAGPSALPTPVGATRVDVGTAEEMARAILEACRTADVLVMAAAVADFRPARVAREKIRKEKGVPALELDRTPDILSAVAEEKARSGRPAVVVGFAAESENLLERARAKLVKKSLSLVVANDIATADAGIGTDTNRVALIDASGAEELPLLPKSDVAERILARVETLLATPRADLRPGSSGPSGPSPGALLRSAASRGTRPLPPGSRKRRGSSRGRPA